MPFWRRRRDEEPVPEPAAPEIDPESAPADWEPDPADFEDPATAETPETADLDLDEGSDATAAAPADRPLTAFDLSWPAPAPTADRSASGPTAAGDIAAEPFEAQIAPGLDFASTEDTATEATSADRLDAGLERTRGGFMSRLRGFLGTGAGQGPSWDDVEETLIAGDVGAALAIDLVERARRRRDPGGPEAAIRGELAALLVPRDLNWSPRSAVAGGPAVVLVVGVNGTGKTTTIGKLASRYVAEGRTVILAAADTFRAAAIDQLRIWADRSHVQMVAHAPGADPGAVVYDALDAAVARGADLVIADTAGRLHTKSNLMDELAKVRRIIDKRLPGADPETLFVLDATTGQNGLSQAKAFHDAVGLTGIVLTKLDSTAKGGIVFAIEDALKVPVRFVGVGEQVGDLIPFDPDAFVAALFG
jgi:fused signal recognition particle receptor